MIILITFALDNFLLITDPQSARVYMHSCGIKVHQQPGFYAPLLFYAGSNNVWHLDFAQRLQSHFTPLP